MIIFEYLCNLLSMFTLNPSIPYYLEFYKEK